MTGWQWFWTLVGFVIYIIILIFLYFYKPFTVLFDLVINGIHFDNIVFWVMVISGIIGFCFYHWKAYRVFIVGQHNLEAMVLSSLRGSAYTAILLSAGAALQAVVILCVYLLDGGGYVDQNFGVRLASVVALVLITGAFCLIFLVLKYIRISQQG